MTRFAYAAVTSAAAAPQLAYRQLIDLGITSSTLYACTGGQYIYALGNTYSPVGPLGGIDAIQEESDPYPRSVRMWLSAVDSSTMFAPLQEDMFGRTVVVRHAYLDPERWTLVATPETLWEGFVNKVEIRFGDIDKGTFYEVEAESALKRSPPITNFNLETHWAVLAQSGDTFFSYIDQVPLTRSLWGQQPTIYVGAGSRPGYVMPPLDQIPMVPYFPSG